MKVVYVFFFFVGLSLSLHAQNDLLTRTLQEFGLDSSTVGYRPQPTWSVTGNDDPFRLHFFDALLARPLKIPNFTRHMLWRYDLWLNGDSANFPRKSLARIRPLASLVMNSGRNLGYDIGKYGFDYSPIVPDNDPLQYAINMLYGDGQYDMGNNVVYHLPTESWSDITARLTRQTGDWPLELRRAVAVILMASREAHRWRDNSLSGIDWKHWNHIFTNTTLEESQCDAHTFDQTVYDAAIAFDGSSAHYGAMLLAQAVEKVLPVLKAHADLAVVLDMPTPMGRVIVRGAGDDTQYASDCLLLIDLGGDDSYLGSTGASSPSLPVSIAIDIAGNDRYLDEHHNSPAQGAGVLGIGMLLDLAGNDSYSATTFSQGCGRFGVGLLFDAEGSDVYVSKGFSQGAGLYGSGILYDRGGDDTYRTIYYAQGYGFSKGLGLLVDLSGDDRYIADDIDLIHVGDETPKHNESDAQGFGAGRRGDHTDGHNMSGGLGILHDLDGNDEYSAGVFAQGSGYWYGMGVLSDKKGDDRYRGVFFNLGASAHWAIGVLFDDEGDDESDLVMTLGFGTAHDCSAAFYIDGGGDDSYRMSNGDDRACSLGSSLNNSFALFANIRGNDSYAPVGNALGYATGRRKGEWTIYAPGTGIFIDIGGNDEYRYKLGGDNSDWMQQDGKVAPGLHGKGVDAAQGMIQFERE